jgi:4-oxalocrotonate tautomerase
MGRKISRRNFLKKSTTAFGSVVFCGFTGLGNAAEKVRNSKTLLGKELKEKFMPHVIVKLWPGRTEQQKIELAKAIVKDVITYADCGEESVSVAIEEIKAEDWAEKVYKPDILNGRGKLYKKPGYKM